MKFSLLRKSPWYRILLWVTLSACLILLWQLSTSVLFSPRAVSNEDHWRYWGAWNLTTRGENPYDAKSFLELQDVIQGLDDQPEYVPVILVPPWTIVLITPFAVLNYFTSRLLWLITSIVFFLISAVTIWRIYEGSTRTLWFALIVSFTFAPTIFILILGQINPWILIGLVGFLFWTTQRRNDWLAGISVALITIKPQLFIPFWIVLLLWIVQQRRWKIPLACGLAIAAASLLLMNLNPLIFQQFLDTYLLNAPLEWYTPTLGLYLRLLMGMEKFWMQFVAPIIAIIWSIYYWFRRGDDWQWTRDIIPLLWVSVLASPYSWTYDQIILIIPILSVTIGLSRHGWNRNTTLWLGIYWFINISTLILHRYFTDDKFIWLAPVLLIWYWLANRSFSARASLPESSAID
ncbi:glycosyltransferase family 87 protein [Chloroflexota bacterium]